MFSGIREYDILGMCVNVSDAPFLVDILSGLMYNFQFDLNFIYHFIVSRPPIIWFYNFDIKLLFLELV